MMRFAAQQHPNTWTLIEFQVNNRAISFCVNPKDQEITRREIVVWTQRPGDHQAGDCCVNPNDQEITKRVIVVWTQRTRRSPGGWFLCEPKGPGDHQAGDCCMNPKDQEITRRVTVVWTQRTRRSPGGWVIAVWTQRTRKSPGGWLLQNLCLWTWLQSVHNLSFLLADRFRKVVKEIFPDSETAKKLSWGRPICMC